MRQHQHLIVSRYLFSSVCGQFQFQHYKPTNRLASIDVDDVGRRRVHHNHRILPIPIARKYSTYYHGEIDSDVDDETMARHNTLTRRLYRILLRTCKQGVELANSGNSFDKVVMGNNNDNTDDKTWILLQPPMDQRKYGFAKIIEARRGKHMGEKDIRTDSVNFNKATHRMSLEDVGMAMEVLRFVHISMGGNADDDLEDYYLTGNPNPRNSDGDGTHDEEHLEGNRDNAGAAAGCHSEGHYTQFIDEDEERGEGNTNTKVAGGASNFSPSDVIRLARWHEAAAASQEKQRRKGDGIQYSEWDDDAEWNRDEYDDEENDVLESDASVLVTVKDLQNAVRLAFRAHLIPPSQSKEDAQPISKIVARRHRDAIDACSRLSEQFSMWGSKSSIAIDWERGVRVVATSSLMKKPTAGTAKKYKFSYRIRVENISDIIDGAIKNNSANTEHRAVQLLGRTWVISERTSSQDESTSAVLQRLLEQGITEQLNSDKQEQESNHQFTIVQTVNEPRTGAGTSIRVSILVLDFAYPNSCSFHSMLLVDSWPFACPWSRRGV